MSKPIVVSGIRSTGNLHLGNYFGAMRNYVRMQEEYNCYFFVADWHALTTHPDTKELENSVLGVLAENIAAGLDPEKVCLYAQSAVPEIAELYLLLNMLAYKGELEKTTTFKDKARAQPDNVNAGLLTYPVLMSKSENQNATLYLADDDELIRKKVMKAKTDSGPTEPNSEMPDYIRNIFQIMSLVSTPDTVEKFRGDFNNANIRYGDMKKQLAEDMVAFIAPIRKRAQEIRQDTNYLRRVLTRGAEQARESAGQTLTEARRLVGLNYLQ
ncbi:MAG: tryptophan--tRNA ligase [Chitinophagaceae bacterium]|nr:MAG: tryptophan--tRNA ligase [Chitinophagaceae bacterium]